jgi:hypothetical protein
VKVEEVLAELVSHATQNKWDILTHEALREKWTDIDSGKTHEKIEYAVRKRASTRLMQEMIYYYYVGDYKIHLGRRNYLNLAIQPMVFLSPLLTTHVVKRMRQSVACFVIIDSDGDLSYLPAKKSGGRAPLSDFQKQDPFRDFSRLKD